MEKTTKMFSDLPEHTQLYLASLKADITYLQIYINSGPLHLDSYEKAKEQYEAACKREGVEPYE